MKTVKVSGFDEDNKLIFKENYLVFSFQEAFSKFCIDADEAKFHSVVFLVSD